MKNPFLHLMFLLVFTIACTGTIIAQTQVELDNKMFGGNWFDTMDEAKQNPEKVYYLDLSLQKLKTFPVEIFTFTNLKELHLPYNYWASIPTEGWGKLTKLELLNLSGNYYLNKLPIDGLAQLKNLKSLLLKDNKLNAGEVDKATKALPQAKVEAK
jgi:Leucine-rich repeat (LRR) protein